MAWGYALLLLAAIALGYLWLRTGDNSLRVQAVKRLAFGIPFFILAFIVGAIFGLYIVTLWLFDATWQFTTGTSGIDSGGRADRLWQFKYENERWLISGDGSPKLYP